MSVNSIAPSVASFSSQSFHSDQPLRGTSAASDQSSTNISVQPQGIGSTYATNKVTPATKQSTDGGNSENLKKPARVMSHIVETYNLQGKKRIKFMDSHNNVVYQIPTEMVAKIEDQMMKTVTATDIKG